MDLLRHLGYFQIVAEELHFGRAAERLGMAQPPLSQRIRRLEDELGVTLFDRSARQVRLTPAGTVLVGEARALLSRVERARTLVGKADRGELGTLRLGVPPEVPGRSLAAIVARFAVTAPDVRLDLQEFGTAEQLRLLADRQLDVGLLQHPVDVTGLSLGPTVDTPLGVVLPRDSELATAGELVPADLTGNGLVLFPRAAAPGLYDATLETCRANGFHPSDVVHARDREFLLGLVLAGAGVALAPATAVPREPRVVWRPLAGEPLRWRMSFAWPASSPHPAAERLADTASAVLRDDGVSRLAPAQSSGIAPWDVVFSRTGGVPPPV